jgi:hypothetical protein
MIPQEGKEYFIEYIPDGKDDSELSYTGIGVYNGKFIQDKEDNFLYWMENLLTEDGFSPAGWFAPEDIKAELTYDQERKTA